MRDQTPAATVSKARAHTHTHTNKNTNRPHKPHLGKNTKLLLLADVTKLFD